MNTRRTSPLAGRKPTREDLARFASRGDDAMDDVLPDPAQGEMLRLLIVGINPGLWTAAVNAPFARPGNRFWPSLYRAGITNRLVDASRGLETEDMEDLGSRGIGITNLLARATARADELSRQELREGGARLVERAARLQPTTVAIAGITAFRAAYATPKAQLGPQQTDRIDGWPPEVALWVVPQPSGLNAHATVDSLAATWHDVADTAGIRIDDTA